MTPDTLELVLDVLAVLLTAGFILRTAPLIRSSAKPMTAALFLFAMASLLLSFAYWIAYTLLRPDTRMPFAANEVGESAVFLLFSAMLKTVLHENGVSAKWEILSTALFASASVALWIGWSGEWVQDSVGGLVFGYFLCVCVHSLKQAGALSRAEWAALGISCAALILGQTGTFFVSAPYLRPLDLTCYAVMFAVLLWLLVKSARWVMRRENAKGALALSCSAYAFSLSTMYMSAGWFYPAAMLFNLATLPLILFALKQEVTA